MASRLFVGNLNPRTTREQIERFFSSAGPKVAAVQVPLDRATSRPRGFAFVEFERRQDAENCMAVFDGRELGGQRLRVQWAREREDLADRWSPAQPVAGVEVVDFDPPDIDHTQDFQAHGPAGSDDYSRDRGRRVRGHGKHASDRRHRVGSRRRVD